MSHVPAAAVTAVAGASAPTTAAAAAAGQRPHGRVPAVPFRVLRQLHLGMAQPLVRSPLPCTGAAFGSNQRKWARDLNTCVRW
eukprot:365219-Chlamydomonas_euryale.AAC.30